MNPENDVVCNLLETPFSRWREEDKRDLLVFNRPTPRLSVSVRKQKKSGNSYQLHFKSTWYGEYTWLCGSVFLQKLFCWACLLLGVKKNVWNNAGFGDFANSTRAFHKHGDSSEHLKCVLQLKQVERNLNSIRDALQESSLLCIKIFNENVRLNRNFMKVVVQAVIYLAKQELPFRGHDEQVSSHNRGNFKELLQTLLSVSSDEVRNQYNKIKCVFSGESKTIQNELIECISDYVCNQIKKEVNETDFFSLQIDDATDVGQNCQCSIIVRFVTSHGKLVERFLGFYDVSSDRTAQALFELIDSILGPLNYRNKLIGQCYDGASVMSGHINGLQKKVKDEVPQAIFIHCLAHRLNLVLQQSCNSISSCRIFFANLSGIPTFFHHSGKRNHILNSIVGRRIPTAVETRWTSNSKILKTVVENWDGLKEVFEEIKINPGTDSTSIRQCGGFLNDMNDFEFSFLALVFYDIFSLTDVLYDVLQKKCLDISYCAAKIRSTYDLINSKRNEEYCNKIFRNAKVRSNCNHKRQHAQLSDEDIFFKYKSLFYEIVDNILSQINTRFHDLNKVSFLSLVDTTKFKDYSKEFPSGALQNLIECYPSIFKKNQRLQNELELLYGDSNYSGVNALKALEMLRQSDVHQDVFQEVYKLFSLVVSLPSTSVSVERSFSCLKRIKTYLRNTISQQRLSSLANISIHRELLSELEGQPSFLDDIIDKFAALKNRRIDLLYKR